MGKTDEYTRKKGRIENVESANKEGGGKDWAEERGLSSTGEDNPKQPPKIYTVRDIARLLRFETITVYRMQQAGKLPAPLPFGRTLRWNGLRFDAWVEEGCPLPDSVAGQETRRQQDDKQKSRPRTPNKRRQRGMTGDGNEPQNYKK